MITRTTPATNRSTRAPGHQEHLKICQVCGEIYDADAPEEAAHHGQPGHAPLLPQRAR